MPEPTDEQRLAAALWLAKWRLDHTHGYVEALAELLAEREAALTEERDKASFDYRATFTSLRAAKAREHLLREALRGAVQRLETIRETHPTIHLDDDIARGRTALDADAPAALAPPPAPPQDGAGR